MKKPLEKDVLKACTQWLSLMRVFHWRNNSGAMIGEHKGKRHFARFGGVKGASDLFCVLPGGRFGAIEVKRPGSKPAEEQAAFMDRVVEQGGFACCVHSVEELIQQMTPLLTAGRQYGY